ncbi:PEP-CTERM sorting domain-containing protein [Marinobacter sp. S0848L]|uniref:PEP-CTERM sorting domain-containing protein n=1 Tax=Marinobacter sp. S0848L TaxID=2926423 RepID=UPI001FF1F4E8|nr:PEP-CTERM sorting domain-containing protein [Marinobacter sp. S0848L]MCK0105491.1 PEP-CTERM sorting domain-containing protein [Marinobacter sp. S0848L]
MKKLTQGLTLAAAMGVTGLAQAAYIDVVANTGPAQAPVAVPGNNDYANGNGIPNGDFIGPQHYGLGDTVLLSHSLESVSSDPFKLTFTYLGKEAGYTGSFLYEGSEVFNTDTSGLGDTFSAVYNGGLAKLDFGFSSVTNGLPVAPAGSVSNMGTGNLANGYNFSIFDAGEDWFILSLDDNNQTDDNHDDMLVMVKATAVPEPGTLALFGLGLAGIAVRMRGRKKA